MLGKYNFSIEKLGVFVDKKVVQTGFLPFFWISAFILGLH
jgi:hypothetical protein